MVACLVDEQGAQHAVQGQCMRRLCCDARFWREVFVRCKHFGARWPAYQTADVGFLRYQDTYFPVIFKMTGKVRCKLQTAE